MRAGVDIGGTFTDLCVAEPDGLVAVGKVLDHAGRARAGRVEAVLREALDARGLGAGGSRRSSTARRSSPTR